MYTISYIFTGLAYAVLYFLALSVGTIYFCNVLDILNYQGAHFRGGNEMYRC